MDQETPTVEAERDVIELDEADLQEAVRQGDARACEAWLEEATNQELVHAIGSLSDAERDGVFAILTPKIAADVIAQVPEVQAIEVLEHLDPAIAAAILKELSSDQRADLFNGLESERAEAILGHLATDVASDVRRLAAYEEESAGGLMLTEFLAVPEAAQVGTVLADLEAKSEEYRDFNILYSYVVDEGGRLRGVLPIHRLLFARRSSVVGDVMIGDPVSLVDVAPLEDVRQRFEEYSFLGLPVVDGSGLLVGVVQRSDVAHAAVEEADDLYRQSQGIVGGEELRSMPLVLRSRRRLAWLSANIVLNIIAASVIAMHQETLEAVIALAVFLPIISDMSGCSGNQAVAVSMRELTIGVSKPRDLPRVLLKECSVGIINGIALGVLIGVVAFLWKGNVYLSAVVGVALAANTLVAVCIGGAVPLVLKGFKTDPALASGPILTTITDMCGFIIVLTLASAMMVYLV